MTEMDKFEESCTVDDCASCGCGCGHNHDHAEEEQPILIDLELEDGSQMQAQVIGVFEFQEKEYIALVPVDDEDAAVMLYRFIDLGNDEADLRTIESDEEFEAVQSFFMDMFFDDEEEAE